MILVWYTIQSYSHRFVGIGNTSMFVIPKYWGRFHHGNLLVFFKALLAGGVGISNFLLEFCMVC